MRNGRKITTMAIDILAALDAEQIAKLNKTIPDFQPGDTIQVNVKVKEGERTRIQAYEGVCIARNGGGLQESFVVRKISYGEGVERVFPLYSPLVESIVVVRRGVVRRAKLYYLRDRRGKSARIVERKGKRRKTSPSRVPRLHLRRSDRCAFIMALEVAGASDQGMSVQF